MKTVYIDSDIFLDVFMRREDFFEPAAELLSLADLKKIKAVTTPLVYSNLLYIIRKYKSAKTALKTLRTLQAMVTVIPVSSQATARALDSSFTDFEDALQYFSSLEAKVDFIVTRNKKDFASSTISVLSAKEFLALYGKKK